MSGSNTTNGAPGATPPPEPNGSPGGPREVATLGGGCFWCTEAVFEETRGVVSAVSGYAGGAAPSPSYEQVCTGRTGHAEVVQVTFDPSVLSFRQVLEIFFRTHDPTTLNRQGADIGTQYRSVVFTHSEEQERVAREVVSALEREGVYDAPIVTEVSPLPKFYPAEDYHQDYFAKNPGQGYCRAVIQPKIAKYRHAFAEILKNDPSPKETQR